MYYDLISNSFSNYQKIFNTFLARRPKQTQRSYKQRIKLFLEWAANYGINNIDEINYLVVEDYVLFLQASDKSPNTINTSLAPIKQFFSHLHAAKLYKHNNIHLVRSFKIDRRQTMTKCPEDKDIHNLVDSIQENNEINTRNKLILLLLINTGIRRTELRDIKISDIKDEFIYINGKGQRKRAIAIHKNIIKKIKHYISTYRNDINEYSYLITSKSNNNINNYISSDSISRIIRELGKSKKIHLSTHMLRVYFATSQYKNNVPITIIQRMMGHESINQTQRYIDLYADISLCSEYAMNKFNE